MQKDHESIPCLRRYNGRYLTRWRISTSSLGDFTASSEKLSDIRSMRWTVLVLALLLSVSIGGTNGQGSQQRIGQGDTGNRSGANPGVSQGDAVKRSSKLWGIYQKNPKIPEPPRNRLEAILEQTREPPRNCPGVRGARREHDQAKLQEIDQRPTQRKGIGQRPKEEIARWPKKNDQGPAPELTREPAVEPTMVTPQNRPGPTRYQNWATHRTGTGQGTPRNRSGTRPGIGQVAAVENDQDDAQKSVSSFKFQVCDTPKICQGDAVISTLGPTQNWPDSRCGTIRKTLRNRQWFHRGIGQGDYEKSTRDPPRN
ncbi:hypothetical protein Bbelb_039390 [Branchiostoma belcheri]|nr:hypothetical protein Bbelb_039390 [Branchiostoma belcheri]